MAGEDCPPSADWAGQAGRAARPDRQRRRHLRAIVLMLCLCGLAGSLFGVAHQLGPRTFSGSQRRQITTWEALRRWRTTPADQLFPLTVRYHLSGFALNSATPLTLSARRIGISQQQGCRAGADPAAAAILQRFGCMSVLRATYADSAGSMLVTVGVAAMPGGPAASSAARELLAADQAGQPAGHIAPASAGSAASPPGVRAAAFAGTIAGHFADGQRQLSWAASYGPYLLMATAGYADGRPSVRVSTDSYADQEMSSLSHGIVSEVGGPLGAPLPVPRCPGAPGC